MNLTKQVERNSDDGNYKSWMKEVEEETGLVDPVDSATAFSACTSYHSVSSDLSCPTPHFLSLLWAARVAGCRSLPILFLPPLFIHLPFK